MPTTTALSAGHEQKNSLRPCDAKIDVDTTGVLYDCEDA